MLELGHRCSIAAVDRLSRDTTDLLVIARDLQKAGAGLRSLTEPVVDTTSARRKSPWREIRTQAETHAAPEARSDQAPRQRRGSLAVNRVQLQCQRRDDCEACSMNAVHLRGIDLVRKMHRFYRLDMQPNLFGGILLVTEWGGIGAHGRMVAEHYDSEALAAVAL